MQKSKVFEIYWKMLVRFIIVIFILTNMAISNLLEWRNSVCAQKENDMSISFTLNGRSQYRTSGSNKRWDPERMNMDGEGHSFWDGKEGEKYRFRGVVAQEQRGSKLKKISLETLGFLCEVKGKLSCWEKAGWGMILKKVKIILNI